MGRIAALWRVNCDGWLLRAGLVRSPSKPNQRALLVVELESERRARHMGEHGKHRWTKDRGPP